MSPRVLLALSGHGYGHAAQAAPAVNALRKRMPDMELIIYSAVPKNLLESRFDGAFQHIREDPDVGMVMSSPIDVRVEATAEAYINFHKAWDSHLKAEKKRIETLKPDLVLADVPYCILAGAQSLGVPSIALCSLNWADVLQVYCGHLADISDICAAIREIYRKCELFLCPEPSMPMKGLDNIRAIGPLARTVSARPQKLKHAISASESQLLVLVALGGIPSKLPIYKWPFDENILFLVSRECQAQARHVVSLAEKVPVIHFAEIQASCDCLIAKPGYNTFVEAAVTDVPVVFVRRGDWPEEPVLVPWLVDRARSLEITRDQLDSGDFLDQIRQVVAMPPRGEVKPSGNEEFAEIVSEYLV